MAFLPSLLGWTGFFQSPQASPPKVERRPLPTPPKSSVSPRRSPRSEKDGLLLKSMSPKQTENNIGKKRVTFRKLSVSPTKPSQRFKNIDNQISIIRDIIEKIDKKSRSDRSLRIETSRECKRAITPPDKTMVNKRFITVQEFNMLDKLCHDYNSDLNKKFINDQGVKDLIKKIQSKNTRVCLEDLDRLVNHLFHFLNQKKLNKS
jgi:hypothetical protein